MNSLMPALTGAVASLSLVAALFFLRFWTRTHDRFFLLFALAFAIDGLSRLVVVAIHLSDESEPYSYLPRLVTFALIIAAVVLKNRK
ncbi:MAG: hypothetical protein JSS04_18695 [Proteobacteria bacterium]|nr:hypothetical protein [Pseudomonadota bacterium]